MEGRRCDSVRAPQPQDRSDRMVPRAMRARRAPDLLGDGDVAMKLSEAPRDDPDNCQECSLYNPDLVVFETGEWPYSFELCLRCLKNAVALPEEKAKT